MIFSQDKKKRPWKYIFSGPFLICNVYISLLFANSVQKSISKLTDKLVPASWQIAIAGGITPNSLVSYYGYIYALDNKKEEITKSRFLNGEVGEGSNWLKEKQDLTGAKSLAIDGSIYVLYQDGKVKKYYQGEERNFALATITNPPTNPLKIFTTDKNKLLYILEKNRLLVYDKAGKLTAQYLSPQFLNLKDVYVSETDNQIYLLNNNEVLFIELN